MIQKEGDYPMRSVKKKLYGEDSPPNSAKTEFIENLKEEMNLSAAKLQRHIYQHHPIQMDARKDHYEEWSIFQGIPPLINCPCCMKRKINKLQRSLGLGLSLYLMTLKAYIKMFLLVSLLSIPTIVHIQKVNS